MATKLYSKHPKYIPLSELSEYCRINFLLKQDQISQIIIFLISQAQYHGATDIHFDLIEEKACIFFKIKGLLKQIASFSQTEGKLIINSIKDEVGISKTNLSAPWSGKISDPLQKNNYFTIHLIPFTPLNSFIIRLKPQTSPETLLNNNPSINKKIFIWQMGKVGSASVLSSIMPYTKTYEWNVDPIIMDDHWLRHNNIFHTHSIQTLYNFLHHSDEEFVVISLVRELMSRNISSIFQSMCQDTLWNNNFIATEEIFRNYSRERQIKEITSKLTKLNMDDHLLNWFNNLFKTHFYYPDVDRYHIDIFSKPFNQEKGFQVYESHTPRIKMIIMRLEDLDNLEEELGTFLGINNFKLIKDNISSNKWYKDIYKNFREFYKPSPAEIDKIFTSKFMKYFYSEKQINEFIKYWANK